MQRRTPASASSAVVGSPPSAEDLLQHLVAEVPLQEEHVGQARDGARREFRLVVQDPLQRAGQPVLEGAGGALLALLEQVGVDAPECPRRLRGNCHAFFRAEVPGRGRIVAAAGEDVLEPHRVGVFGEALAPDPQPERMRAQFLVRGQPHREEMGADAQQSFPFARAQEAERSESVVEVDAGRGNGLQLGAAPHGLREVAGPGADPDQPGDAGRQLGEAADQERASGGHGHGAERQPTFARGLEQAGELRLADRPALAGGEFPEHFRLRGQRHQRLDLSGFRLRGRAADRPLRHLSAALGHEARRQVRAVRHPRMIEPVGEPLRDLLARILFRRGQLGDGLLPLLAPPRPGCRPRARARRRPTRRGTGPRGSATNSSSVPGSTGS